MGFFSNSVSGPARKSEYVRINFDHAKELGFIIDSSDKAIADTMDRAFDLSQEYVRVKTGALKETGRYGVKKKKYETIGWLKYGKKGLRYAVVEESRNPYLKRALDRASKGVEDEIKVKP